MGKQFKFAHGKPFPKKKIGKNFPWEKIRIARNGVFFCVVPYFIILIVNLTFIATLKFRKIPMGRNGIFFPMGNNLGKFSHGTAIFPWENPFSHGKMTVFPWETRIKNIIVGS